MALKQTSRRYRCQLTPLEEAVRDAQGTACVIADGAM